RRTRRMLEEADHPPLPAQPGAPQPAGAIGFGEQLSTMVEIAVTFVAHLANSTLAKCVVAIAGQYPAIAAGAADPPLRAIVERHAAMTCRQSGVGGRAGHGEFPGTTGRVAMAKGVTRGPPGEVLDRGGRLGGMALVDQQASPAIPGEAPTVGSGIDAGKAPVPAPSDAPARIVAAARPGEDRQTAPGAEHPVLLDPSAEAERSDAPGPVPCPVAQDLLDAVGRSP